MKLTYPAKWATTCFYEECVYEIQLIATLFALFHSKNPLGVNNCRVAACRFSFGNSDGDKSFFPTRSSDSYSISGVEYKAENKEYNQIRPMVSQDATAVTLIVKYNAAGLKILNHDRKQSRFIEKDPRFACFVLWAQNVTAKVRKLSEAEVPSFKAKYLRKETICSICIGEVTTDFEETKCGHGFH